MSLRICLLSRFRNPPDNQIYCNMEEKFIIAWEHNRANALLLGIRMRPLDVNAARRILSGSRLSDGFNELARQNALHLSLEALAIDRRFTALFSDEEANEALSRLLEKGYRF